MQQARILITPYELFSSAFGGVTIVMAIILMYSDITDFPSLYELMKTSITIKDIIVMFIASYLLGGLTAGITFRIYNFVRKIFKMNNKYYEINISNIQKFHEDLKVLSKQEFMQLQYLERLSYLLSKKVNNINSFYKSIISVIPYIRKQDLLSARSIDHHMAQHIMYRGISFGFILMAGVIAFKIYQLEVMSVDSIIFLFVILLGSVASFTKSHNFIRWHRREILNSFYQIAFDDFYPASDKKTHK